MRRVLLAAAAISILGGGAAHAATVMDPTGDFLSSFTGSPDADLDVTSFGVTYDAVASAFTLTATLAGAIDPSKPGFYVIGVNTGTGPMHPFGPLGQPNVRFNQVIVFQKTGVGVVSGNAVAGTITGDSFSLVAPLGFLPSTGFAPERYGFNVWPRGAGGAQIIADFAPENSTLSVIPEPATWAMMVSGFALVGGAIRRRRRVALAA
ncbi:MAG: hypothetical protein JWO33_671 [Caulobacteraceae bacterium]|nr:hypothetical protein [Caulobacteraceae bacterium]